VNIRPSVRVMLRLVASVAPGRQVDDIASKLELSGSGVRAQITAMERDALSDAWAGGQEQPGRHQSLS
jgi:predicted ArsR family transcriptional regulator